MSNIALWQFVVLIGCGFIAGVVFTYALMREQALALEAGFWEEADLIETDEAKIAKHLMEGK